MGYERDEVNLQYFLIMYGKIIKAQDKEPDKEADCVHFLRWFFSPIENKLPIRRRKKNQDVNPAHCYMGYVKTLLKLLHLEQA